MNISYKNDLFSVKTNDIFLVSDSFNDSAKYVKNIIEKFSLNYKFSFKFYYYNGKSLESDFINKKDKKQKVMYYFFPIYEKIISEFQENTNYNFLFLKSSNSNYSDMDDFSIFIKQKYFAFVILDIDNIKLEDATKIIKKKFFNIEFEDNASNINITLKNNLLLNENNKPTLLFDSYNLYSTYSYKENYLNKNISLLFPGITEISIEFNSEKIDVWIDKKESIYKEETFQKLSFQDEKIFNNVIKSVKSDNKKYTCPICKNRENLKNLFFCKSCVESNEEMYFHGKLILKDIKIKSNNDLIIFKIVNNEAYYFVADNIFKFDNNTAIIKYNINDLYYITRSNNNTTIKKLTPLYSNVFELKNNLFVLLTK